MLTLYHKECGRGSPEVLDWFLRPVERQCSLQGAEGAALSVMCVCREGGPADNQLLQLEGKPDSKVHRQ